VETTLPAEGSFNVTLDQIVRDTGCQSIVKGLDCDFSYRYNFMRNIGLAYLQSIGGTKVDIVLYPIGLSGMYAFMSDMTPTTVTIGVQAVVLYRVLMNLYNDGSHSAAIMFNNNGSCIAGTSNWDSLRASGLGA
jgi:hypothetical protein